jgi:parvulin-like peptidyl-prolyl isomerase
LAKKKKVEKSKRQFTRRQLSNIKRQKRRQRLILYGGIFIIIAVITVVVVGLYMGEIRPYQQTALKVYDREFSARYLMDATKYYALKYYGEYYTPELFIQNLSDLVSQVPSIVIQTELERRAAAELGITVSNDEVKESLKENELPVNDASIDLDRVHLLRQKLLDEYFEPALPSTAPQVNIMAMLLESEQQANDITEELEAGTEFTTLAEEYSLQTYTKSEKGELGWHVREVLEVYLQSTVPVDYAFGAEAGTLSPPIFDEEFNKSVGYWVVEILDKPAEDQAHLQAILVGSLQEAEDVIQRLNDGEEFGEIAQEVSQDEESRDSGGDLGLVTKGDRTTAFDEAVFNSDSEVGEILPPIRDEQTTTNGGYWLVDVVDKAEDRPLEESDQELLANTDHSDWLSQLYEDAAADIDINYLTQELQSWMMEKLIEETS